MLFSNVIKRLLERIRSYLAGKRNSEFEQALIRIVIGTLLLYYFAQQTGTTDGAPELHVGLLQALAVFLGLSMLVTISVLVLPGEYPVRRGAAILLDTGTLTYIFLIGGGHAAPLFFLYLWIIIGYGFRFGHRYLYLSLLAALIGFGFVISQVPYWRAERGIAVGLWLGMLLVSLYFSMLVGRLYNALEQSEIANVAKRQFICSVSHELRTPLNAFIGMVDLMKTTRIDREQADMLDTMTMTSQLMLSQIEDVLDFSKIEAGKMSLEQVDFDLYQLAQGILSVFRYRIDPTRITLTCHIDARVPFRVHGDPHHLRQILVNLLGNAVKFTEQGSICLRIDRLEIHVDNDSDVDTDIDISAGTDAGTDTETPVEGVRLRFSVTDTGIGIPASAHARIFDSFTQASESTARRYGGTGLGTTICKQLVELMGGEIGFSSEEGSGSEFWFIITLAPSVTIDRLLAGIRSSSEPDIEPVGGLGHGFGREPVGETSSWLVRGLILADSHSAASRADITRFDPGMWSMAASLAEAKFAIEQSLIDEQPIALVFISMPRLFLLPPDEARLAIVRIVNELSRSAGSRALLTVLGIPACYAREQAVAIAAAAGCFSALHDDDEPACIGRLLHAAELAGVGEAGKLLKADDVDGLKVGAGKVESSQDSDSYKILVAEDNSTNRKVIQKILERAGHQCFMTRNGEEAMDLVDKRQFDALILDMNMPGMSGIDAARMYRLMHAEQARLPILMFSANVTPEARAEGLEAGADEFLPKPVQVELLLQTLNRLVTRYRSGDISAAQLPQPLRLSGFANQHATEPVLDRHCLMSLEDVSNDPRFLDDLIVEFMTENRQMIDRLESSLDGHDWDRVRDILHTITGSSLSVGAVSLKALCRQLEKLSPSEMKANASDMMFEIRQAFLRLCQELELYRQQRPPHLTPQSFPKGDSHDLIQRPLGANG